MLKNTTYRELFLKTVRIPFTATILGYFSLFGFIETVKAQATTNPPQPPTVSTASSAETPTEPATLGGYLAVPRQQTFVISAYYSPLPGQKKYVTGSYEGDIRLNGDGVKAADGSNVYPGMIAAPKSYAFGTKMEIPGVGTVAVHDRGGAIVHSGEKGNSYDRLDVWMGYGDAGLKRALQWGKRTVEVTVYGVDPSIQENVYLEGYSESEQYAVSQSVSSDVSPDLQNTGENSAHTLPSSLGPGSKGEDVKKVQEALQKLGHYSGEITGNYDTATVEAVSKFQVAEKIIQGEYDYGSGHFGPKTVKALARKLNVETANAQEEKTPPLAFTRDLKLGDSGEDVRNLQEELKRVHLLGIDPSGYYGEVTAHAVLKFQQTQSLVGHETSPGAGIFGPKTRAVLNDLVAQRLETQQSIDATKDSPST